jgi:predicted dehydrogenase
VAASDHEKRQSPECCEESAQAAYTSLEALVADTRVDVVFIASPNFLHAPYTLIAAQAGKHVLVEKPMAVRVDEAVEMIRTCRAHGVKLVLLWQFSRKGLHINSLDLTPLSN